MSLLKRSLKDVVNSLCWSAVRTSNLIYSSMQLTTVVLTTMIDMLKGTSPHKKVPEKLIGNMPIVSEKHLGE